MNFIIKFGLTICSIVLVAPGCGKDNEKKPGCSLTHVSNVYSSGSSTYDFTYDDNGRIATLASAGGVNSLANFSYSGNSVLRTLIDGFGSIVRFDSLVMNPKGLIEFHQIRQYGAAPAVFQHYYYNSSGQLTTSTFQYMTQPPETTTYTYSGEDLISEVSPGETTGYTWYEDKDLVPGDLTIFLQVLSDGAIHWRPKHLLKTRTQDGVTSDYTYTYDEHGQIATMSVTRGTQTQSFTNTFACPQ